MKKELEQVSRRQMIAKAGLALGGVATLGALACGSDSSSASTTTTPVEPPVTGPQVADFPYDKHIGAGYQLKGAPIQEAAYHAYYDGGCCHGAYSSLLGHLAETVGAPFNLLPKDFGKFGGGGIAGFGTICGAVLGGVMIINHIVSKADVRAKMMTELMRWYEGYNFPHYVPAAVDTRETGTTKDFSASNIATLQVVPGSQLCHASVSKWCAANGVSAKGADKIARCSRLTADVAGKVAEILNTYLSTGDYAGGLALDATSQSCTGCHPATSPTRPVASGMTCTSCHPDKTTFPHPL